MLCSGLLSHVPKLLILFKSMVLDSRRNAVYCLVNYEGFALGLLGLSRAFARLEPGVCYVPKLLILRVYEGET